MAIRWPKIRSRGYSDESGIAAALQLAEDCEDCDLIGSLDDLESALAEHGESELCREAEDCVEHAVLVITNAFSEEDD